MASAPPVRLAFDPVELPRLYGDPRDAEVTGLLSALLAYGRADLFKPKLRALLGAMGPSPAAFVTRLDAIGAARLLRGFVYRFNVGADLAVLLLGMGWALREKGSLEALFEAQLRGHGSIKGALGAFTRSIRCSASVGPVRRALGRERGLDHLLPLALGDGPAKRLNLFLRWMVRGPDEVDLGLWRSVTPAQLVVPLDTHLARVSRRLGLTRRKDLSWKTAEEVTTSLRLIDPGDPVRFDFALCHLGMSGACPPRPSIGRCSACPLLGSCRVGPTAVARAVARELPDPLVH